MQASIEFNFDNVEFLVEMKSVTKKILRDYLFWKLFYNAVNYILRKLFNGRK